METKPWWQSTTIRGAIVAILGAIAGVLSITGVVSIGTPEIDLIVSSIFTAIGGVMSIIGRYKATTTIGASNTTTGGGGS